MKTRPDDFVSIVGLKIPGLSWIANEKRNQTILLQSLVLNFQVFGRLSCKKGPDDAASIVGSKILGSDWIAEEKETRRFA